MLSLWQFLCPEDIRLFPRLSSQLKTSMIYPRIGSADVNDFICHTNLVGGIRCGGSADHLGRLEEEGWGRMP